MQSGNFFGETVVSTRNALLSISSALVLTFTIAASESASVVAAANAPVPAPAPAAAPAPAPVPEALPPYEFPWTNGLYASAAGYLSVKNVCLDCERTYILKVPGACNCIPVKAIIQESSAPLVVVLLGIEGRPDDDFSKLWPLWLAQSGYHVLTFDSTFTQEFNSKSLHGVTGNLWVESEIAKNIIAAFIEQTCVNGRVSKIGIAGMSYGGIEALMIGTMAADKKTPFEVSAIQAYSPPISLMNSAKIVDGWYAETYGQYTLVELLQLKKHCPCRSNPESPVSDCMLKAAAANSFRLPLPQLIAYNDQAYHLQILPKGDEFDDAYVRADHGSRWTFTRFAFNMSYPYWQRKLNVPDLQPMIHAADLGALLARQPAFSEIIIAEDDPLDYPADMQAFKTQSAGKRVTFLPRGGHLGYIAEDWTRAKLLSMFNASK